MSVGPPVNHRIDVPQTGERSSEDLAATFARGGEMGARMRSFDWVKTPLGPVADWPQSLKTSLSICLASRFPIVLYWGPECVVLYNDAYSQILGSKHPWALGQTCRVCWAEIWDTIGPMLESVLKTGKATWSDDLLLMLRRFGFAEECYFSFSFSPVQAESGAVGGIFTAVIETTEKVIGERRLRTLRDLAAHAVHDRSQQDVWRIAAGTLGHNAADVPFAVLAETTAGGLRVAGVAGIEGAHRLCAELCRPDRELSRIAAQVVATGQKAVLNDLASWGMELPRGPWDSPPHTALLLPVTPPGQASCGLLLAAVSPAKNLDESYSAFFDLLARQIAGNMADARSFEEEKKRAESLAELDRAKTLFFSNISHELRTPLTLLLGPTEAALAAKDGVLNRADLAMLHRNELRLLKLVNTLLDFSRIEAGSVKASYELVDLGVLTTEIASAFRSTIEKAGLRFRVECEQIQEPVYVDRHMWEKIVFNLLSNAFKFTFDGSIEVTLGRAGESAELTVRDTGIGIAAEDLPRIFERFHRIENVHARTHEGTGIGLALVQELVRLHGGSIAADSRVGQGSAFRVRLPLGKDHLAADRIQAVGGAHPTPFSAAAYVDEAERWLPQFTPARTSEPDQSRQASRPAPELILVADDNADMRDYLSHLLRDRYEVSTAADGVEAVEAARQLRPALVIADVMMPRLDGFGLLRAIREDEQLRPTPVVLLSARAGEESQVEGFDAGADDYLVKPFTARELLARVSTHLRMARVRREATEREAELRAQAELEKGRLQELLSRAPAAIGLLSGPEHRWTFVNESCVRLTGRNSPADFLGQTVLQSLPEIRTQAWIGILDEVFRTGTPYVGKEVGVLLNRPASARPRESYWDFVCQPVRNANGGVEGVLVYAIEVTEKVAAQRASQHLAAIVESSDAAIVSKDLQGVVTSWNSAAENIFGYSAEEMIGRSITTIIPPELQADEDRILATIARGERIEHFETVRLTRSGRRIDVSLTISPVKDQAGNITGAAKIARDITQQKRAEQALRVTERLASVGRLAATVAHEINNPLEAVTNYIYLARTRATRDDVRAFLRGAEEELERVSHLTKQTLGFYRETKGATPTRMAQLLGPLMTVFSSRIRNKQIQILHDMKDDPEIMAIPGEIRQLFANLLGNSIDAVDRGGRIIVRVRRITDWKSGGSSCVRLTVADSGSGIPAEIRSKLFQPFFTTKKDVGTGLGLWVCKSIVEKHGGRIMFRSRTEPGRSGTVFAVLLPLEEQDLAPPQEMRLAG